MPLTTQVFAMHLAACVISHGAGASVDRVRAVAQHESHLDPWALHDNSTGRSWSPVSIEAASTLAAALIARGHSVDAGVMQVNDANWQRLGLTSATVFDPGLNICAGARILAEDYAIERRATCRYNTGRPNCTNGYPEAVDRLQAASVASVTLSASPAIDGACGMAPPSWDGWAMASYAACVADRSKQQETFKP